MESFNTAYRNGNGQTLPAKINVDSDGVEVLYDNKIWVMGNNLQPRTFRLNRGAIPAEFREDAHGNPTRCKNTLDGWQPVTADGDPQLQSFATPLAIIDGAAKINSKLRDLQKQIPAAMTRMGMSTQRALGL